MHAMVHRKQKKALVSTYYITDIMPEERLVLHNKNSKSVNVDLLAKQLNLTWGNII